MDVQVQVVITDFTLMETSPNYPVEDAAELAFYANFYPKAPAPEVAIPPIMMEDILTIIEDSVPAVK